jgi:DHA2 family lincomycin resistance protein-like MFS transporter
MLVGLHEILSIGFACLFTPAFTSGLNPLPPSLYSHGSAIMATLQQVSGAAGTALLVTIMAGRTMSLMSAGMSKLDAQVSGLHTAFAVAAGVAVLAVVLSLFLRNPKPATGSDAQPDAALVHGSEARVGDS